jgi:hypothetical protein
MSDPLNIIVLAGDEKSVTRKIPGGNLSYRDAAVTACSAISFASKTVVVSGRTLGSLGGGTVIGALPGKTAAESLENGMKKCQIPCWLLIIAADLPHISGDALAAFYAGIEGKNATAYIGYTSLEDCATLNHDSKHFVILDGKPTKLASVFLVHTSVFEANKGALGKLIKQRKSPAILGLKLLGVKWALKYLRKQNLGLAELIAAFVKRNGFTIAGIPSPAELAVDDDTK